MGPPWTWIDRGNAGPAAPPRRGRRSPERHRDGQPVAGRDGPMLGLREAAHPQGGRAALGEAPGPARDRLRREPDTGRIQRSSGSRLDSPTARIPLPSGIQATASQTPSNGSIRAVSRRRVRGPRRDASAGGPAGASPGPRLPSGPRGAAGAPRGRATWTKRVPSGDESGAIPNPPPGSPCSTAPVVRALRSVPSASTRTTWNHPSASLRSEQATAVRQPARAGRPLAIPGHGALLARREVQDRHLVREEVRIALGGERQARPVRRPGEVVDGHPGGRDRARLRDDRAGGAAGRGAAGARPAPRPGSSHDGAR